MGKQIEGERSGGEEKHPDPDRQVSDAIAPRVALAHVAVFRVFHLDWVSHLTAIVPQPTSFSISGMPFSIFTYVCVRFVLEDSSIGQKYGPEASLFDQGRRETQRTINLFRIGSARRRHCGAEPGSGFLYLPPPVQAHYA